MKLLFMILRDIDAEIVSQSLVDRGYRITRVASTGGFLRRGNVTLMCGVEQRDIPALIEVLREKCTPAENGQKRATVFVVDMPYYEQI
jgi:uncharacterized protein YaaQ